MKLTKRQLRKIIREEKRRLLESELSYEEYHILEQCAYDLTEACGVQFESEDMGEIVDVLLQVVIPKLQKAGIV